MTSTIQPAPGTSEYYYQLAHWDDDVRPQNIAGCIISGVAATVFTIFRIYSQIVYSGKLRPADYLILAAWPFTAAEVATLSYSFSRGMGLHQLRVVKTDTSPPNTIESLFITAGYLEIIFWCLSLMLTKLSLVLYYHELFYVNQKWLKFSIRLLYLYILLWGIGTFFDAVFKCSPISYAWEAATVYYGLPPPETGTCQPEVEHIAVPAILSTISDVGLFLLPAVILSGLKMNTHEKLGLMALFSLGLFTIGVGIVRIVFCYQVTTTQDFTWDNAGAVVWTCVEVCFAMVCASIPPAMPAIKALLRSARLLPPSSESSGYDLPNATAAAQERDAPRSNSEQDSLKRYAAGSDEQEEPLDLAAYLNETRIVKQKPSQDEEALGSGTKAPLGRRPK